MFLNDHHEWQAFTIATTLQQAAIFPTHYCVPLLNWNAMFVTDHHVMLGHCYEAYSIFIVFLQPFSRYMYQLKLKEVTKMLQGC